MVIEMREVRSTALGAAIVLAYATLVLLTGRVDLAQFSLLFLAYIGGSFALWQFLGIVWLFVHIFRQVRASRGRPVLGALIRETLVDRWQRDRGASLIWPPLLFGTLMASFNAFKQMVLPVAGYRYDALFARADHLLFFGHDGWRVTHAMFASPGATLAIDRLYHGWFVPVALGVMLCAWLPASTYRLRTQYLLSYMGVWIVIGSVLAFLLPSAGPCFYTRLVGPEPGFAALMQRLADVQSITGSSLLALHNQSVLWHAHIGDHLAVGGGISAMPSVHNGLAVLFALAAWRINRVLGVVFAIYAVAIWIGSIHLGWHYAVDGIAAAILTVAIWRICGRIADRLERPLFVRAAVPAIA